MESKEEKFLKALFGDEPKAKSLSFWLELEDVIVDVSIKKTKKNEENKCIGCCSKNCSSCKGGNCKWKLIELNLPMLLKKRTGMFSVKKNLCAMH